MIKNRFVVAIGGYQVKNGKEFRFEPIEVNRKIIEITGKKYPRVLFMPTASNDSNRYCSEFLNMFGNKLKCKTDILKLYDKSFDLNKIPSSDVIYVGGGNTLRMMNLFRRLGVDKLLLEAYAKGTVMTGVSAGSICWFKAGVSDSRQFKNPNSNQYIRVSGLGILPWLNNPHVNSELFDRKYRTDGMNKILSRTNENCYAIEDGAALIFKNEEFVEKIGNGNAYLVSNESKVKL